MEVVAGIGACVAIFQVAGAFIKLTKKVNQDIRDIQAAPYDVKIIVEETTIFTSLLTIFGGVLRKMEEPKNMEDSDDTRRRKEMKRLAERIKHQCRAILRDVQSFRKQFKNVLDGQDSTLRVYVARMMWVLRKPDTRELRLRINSTKHSMNLLVGLYQLELELKKSAAADERFVRIYRDMLRTERNAAERVLKELEVLQKQKQSPDIWVFTEGATEIQDFVVEAVNTAVREKLRPARASVQHPSATEVLARDAAIAPPRPPPSPRQTPALRVATEVLEREAAAAAPPRSSPRRPPPPPPPPRQMSAPRVAADTGENEGEIQPRSQPEVPRPEAEESEDEDAAEAPTSGPSVQSRWQPVPPFDGKAPKLWRRPTSPS